MAEGTQFRGWMLTLGGSLAAGAIVTVGSLLWQGNAQMARMQVTLEVLVRRMDQMEGTLNEATRQRYSSADAATDKNAILAICAADRQAFMTALDKARSDCVKLLDGETATNKDQEARLRALEVWAAKNGGAK